MTAFDPISRLSRFLFIAVCSALVLTARLQAAAVAPSDVTALAVISASTNDARARSVADGKVPAAGCRDDQGQVWVIGAKALPASLVFEWKEPTPVSTVVYYGRTTWGIECFKDFEIYVDDSAEPLCKGTFLKGHGPQQVSLPKAVTVRKLVLKFLTAEGGSPGAAEIQLFSTPPTKEALLCRFSSFELDFRYAYFPSRNQVRFLVPKPPPDAKVWSLAVRKSGSPKILAERSGDLPMSAAGENMPVPDLPEGEYVLTLTLAGGAEPVVEERAFQRHHYEWEGQKIGLDDVVIPPFEPLAVDKKKQTVSCVLRQHKIGAAGLWSQVTSQGLPLLAGPMRLEVTSGGKMTVADGRAASFSKVKPTRVTGEAAWKAGSLSGRTSFAYDYDGLMEVTLRLSPTKDEIERVQLVIPIKASEASLMHPVTTGLRQHYAGYIPPGEGKVWDSSKAPGLFSGTFVPYIFVGGPERGICFAADNDRDWILDPKVPELEIDRTGEIVNLRLNLVARPSRLSRERTITFALQATPAKPMPETPYPWRRWWATGTAPDIEDVQISLWGANMYWGGRHFASSVFPAFKDYGFWEQLAKRRGTGKGDPDYLEKWMARFADVPAEERGGLRAHYEAGLNWACFSPTNSPATKKVRYVIPYINARGGSVENQDFMSTYLDEWLSGDVADPKWKSYSDFQRPKRLSGWGCWYEIEPVPTRIDMLLFYHRKMIETFADGIYWDNFFLQPSYVPASAGGPGYIDDDGVLRPGVNLMGFRNLVKRNAVMMHMMGKRPLSYIHMTNVNIVPILAFGTINLDWEWRDQGKYALLDLQDRLGVDRDTGLILAQSLGLQAGNISVAINRFTPPKDSGIDQKWLMRTAMAVCLPHELKIDQGGQAESFVQTQLAKFGYGQPDCRIYRYWEPGFPLTAQGANIHALVLSRGPKAMIALGHYGQDEPVSNSVQSAAAPSLADYDAAQRQGGGVAGVPVSEPGAGYAANDVTITLDLKGLGLPETVRAFDVERKAGQKKALPPGVASVSNGVPAELTCVAPGVFQLRLMKHDFMLISVE